MAKDKSIIIDDLPTDKDALDFAPYVEALVKIVKTARTPLTVGVFGKWGSGKTSLMRMVKSRLPKTFPVVWFDAWKYEREEALWRALIVRVLGTLRAEEHETKADQQDHATFVKTLDDLEASLYRAVEREEKGEVRIDWGEVAKGAGKAVLHLGFHLIPGVGSVFSEMLKKGEQEFASNDLDKLFGAIQRERHKIYREHVQSLEQFQEQFEKLIAIAVEQKGRRLVVFVDDLDRCLPEKAIEVLEAIKLFMDVPGCLFLLGLDHQVIARGIEIKYRELGWVDEASEEKKRQFMIEGARYLEKIIQVPFQIPPIAPGVMGDFVRDLVEDWPHEQCPGVFAEGLGESPRQVKRTVNTFLLLWELAQARGQEQIKPVRLAKVVAIQQIDQELYDVLKETPRLLRDLEAHYRAEESRTGERGLAGAEAPGEERTRAAPAEPPPALAPFVSQAALRRVLLLHPPAMEDANFTELSPEALKVYFTLTRSTETPATAPTEAPRAGFEPQTVPIPAGRFLMGSTEEQAAQAVDQGAEEDWVKQEQPQHTVELSAYGIGKYPVTNVEYQAFVRDAGHEPPQHWDGDAYPEGKGDHPVVNVSWEDATAYCQWLSEKTGKEYQLPTEAQWEKAARGDDGWIYPWGNEWDAARLNSAEGGRGDTSSVGQYSTDGDSPYGCADVAGNVWEWCADRFEEAVYKRRAGSVVKDPEGPKEGPYRVLRGGSFANDDLGVRCSARIFDLPSGRNYYVGFRVVFRPLLFDGRSIEK